MVTYKYNIVNKDFRFSNFIYYILPLYFLFDSFTIILFKAGSLFTLIRGTLVILFILYSYTFIKLSKKDLYVFLLLFQTILLLPLSNNIFVSVTIAAKVFISIFMFPIGFHLIKGELQFKKLIKFIPILLIIILINFILGKFFNVGYDVYDKNNSLRLGNFSDNVNVFTYTLLIVPLYFIYEKNSVYRISVLILSATIGIVILLAMKRVAILGIVLGYFFFLIFSGKFFKYIKWIVLVILGLYLFLPLYHNLLIKRYEAREDRLQFNSLANDGRVWETKLIWSEVLSFKDPIKSIFGEQTFNSPNNYADDNYKGRRLHVDYNEIIFGNGIIGLLLYFCIYISIANYYFKYKVQNSNYKYSVLKGVFWSLLLTSLFTSLSGQYYALTFRTIIFLFLGAILRQFYNTKILILMKHIERV